MSSGQLIAAAAALCDAVDALAAAPIDGATHTELLAVLSTVETATRKLPTQHHRVLARLHREASPTELGAKSLRDVLRNRLRISGKDANRRLDDAADLGPRTALNGQPLGPVLAKVAAAQAHGLLGAEHVKIIRRFFDDLPSWVDQPTREQAEADLVRHALALDPDALRAVAKRLLALIDQDGPAPDDAERARKRFITLGPQQPDGMTRLTGLLDPQARSTVEPLLAKLAAPGMCNPNDPEPRVSGTPTQEQIDTDTRTLGQRTHDALIAVGRSILSSGELGQHNGLPVTIIVSTTLQDLQSAAGCGVTAGGSLLPMADLIRMASHAIHYLRIYDTHTREELYLGRTKRLASVAQRIVLYDRDRGCTKPGCTVPAYGTQVHHTNGWTNNGQSNIDEEALACPADNRLAETGWTVRIHHGTAEWIPPPHLDTGQPRTNAYHHPDRILGEPEEPEPESGDAVDT